MENSSDNMWIYEQAIMEDPDFFPLHQMDLHGCELGDDLDCNIGNNFKPDAASDSSPKIISFQTLNSTYLGQVVHGGSNLIRTMNMDLDDESLSVFAMISGGKSFKKNNNGVEKRRTVVGNTTRRPLHAQDHVMAERKRREKLSQRFIALSSILPRLKKMDKASVLEDAIDYLRNLEQRVRILEEQTSVQTVECAVVVKTSHDHHLHDHQSLPDVEARVSDKEILLKIICKNQKGCLGKILNEIEKLHLSIHKTSVLPFGNLILDITIVARIDVDYCMTTKDLVRSLRKAIVQVMI